MSFLTMKSRDKCSQEEPQWSISAATSTRFGVQHLPHFADLFRAGGWSNFSAVGKLPNRVGRVDRCSELSVRFITLQSLIRIRFSPLQPHGSEMKRPWGFVLRWRRDGASYPQDSQGLADFTRRLQSLDQRRARPHAFTRSALSQPDFGPSSRPSLRLAPPGLRRVGFPLSVATYRGWPRSSEDRTKSWCSGFRPSKGQLARLQTNRSWPTTSPRLIEQAVSEARSPAPPMPHV